MFCTQCGQQNTQSNRFCTNCGAALTVSVPKPAERSLAIYWLIAGGSAFLILLGALLAWLLGVFPQGQESGRKPPLTEAACRFIGSWVSDKPNLREISRVQISAESETLFVHIWSNNYDWSEGKTTLSDADDGILSVTWNTSSFQETQKLSVLPDGRLRIDGNIQFTDNSGRPNFVYDAHFLASGNKSSDCQPNIPLRTELRKPTSPFRDQAWQIVTQALQDRDQEIRDIAASALLPLGRKLAHAHLIQLLRKSQSPVSLRARIALGDESALIELLERPWLGVAWGPSPLEYELIASLHLSDDTLNQLIQRLGNRNASIRWSAAHMLMILADKRSVPALIQVFQDTTQYPDRLDQQSYLYIRFLAAITLGKIGDPVTAPVLRQALARKDSPNEDEKVLAGAAMMALAQLGDKSVTADLRRWSQGASLCAFLFYGLREDWVIEDCVKDLQLPPSKENYQQRLLAAMNLLFYSVPESTLRFKSLLNDPQEDLRSVISVGLMRTGDSSAIPVFMDTIKPNMQDLSDSQFAFNFEKLGPVAVPVLAEIIRNHSSGSEKDLFVRFFSAIILGQIGNSSALSTLESMLQDSARIVQVAAAAALLAITGVDGLGMSSQLEQPPSLSFQGYVSDYVGILSAEMRNGLFALPKELEIQIMAQAVGLIVKTTQPLDDLKYAVKVFDDWKIGKTNNDRGLLFLVSVGDCRTRIITSYEFKRMLPDDEIGAILDQNVIPHFQQGDFCEGIFQGVWQLALVIADAVGGVWRSKTSSPCESRTSKMSH